MTQPMQPGGAHRAAPKPPLQLITTPTFPLLEHWTRALFEAFAWAAIGICVLAAAVGTAGLLGGSNRPGAALAGWIWAVFVTAFATGVILAGLLAVLAALAAAERRGPNGQCGDRAHLEDVGEQTCAVTNGHPGTHRSDAGHAWIRPL